MKQKYTKKEIINAYMQALANISMEEVNIKKDTKVLRKENNNGSNKGSRKLG